MFPTIHRDSGQGTAPHSLDVIRNGGTPLERPLLHRQPPSRSPPRILLESRAQAAVHAIPLHPPAGPRVLRLRSPPIQSGNRKRMLRWVGKGGLRVRRADPPLPNASSCARRRACSARNLSALRLAGASGTDLKLGG